MSIGGDSMKKLLAIVLATVCVLSFSACDSDKNNSSEDQTKTSTATTATTEPTTTTTTKKTTPTTTTKKATTTTTALETMYTFDFLFNTDYLVFQDSLAWNMNKRKVEQKDTRSSTDLDGGSGIIYSQMDKDYDEYVDYVYLYEDEKLKAYFVMLDEITDAYDSVLYYDYYVTYRDIIKAKYGAWESETITWSDEEYKNDKAMWNTAFGLGDFSIKTVWHLQDQTIVMNWGIDSMSTTFCTPEYESLL